MKLEPLHDRIIVKRVEAATKTAGGIFIPDSAQEKPKDKQGYKKNKWTFEKTHVQWQQFGLWDEDRKNALVNHVYVVYF